MSKKKQPLSEVADLGHIVALIIPTSDTPQKSTVYLEVFTYLQKADFSTVIVLSHTQERNTGKISLYNGEVFPVGEYQLRVDTELLNELCDEEDDFFSEDIGQVQNEAIQQILRAVVNVRSDIEVLPVMVGSNSLSISEELGHALGEVMHNRSFLLLAAIEIDKVDQATLGAFIGSLETMQINPLIRMIQSGEVKLHSGNGSIIGTLLAAQRRGVKQAKVLTSGHNQFLGAVLYR
ncbi:MAG: MEMO1 family protein [Rhodothermia bacterium]|nr:MEMO1 family protein [Rhodothermia bacterium]